MLPHPILVQRQTHQRWSAQEHHFSDTCRNIFDPHAHLIVAPSFDMLSLIILPAGSESEVIAARSDGDECFFPN
jgi:hypothetical protein